MIPQDSSGKNKAMMDAPLTDSGGYYDNYREMKEHASRHPKAVVHGGIGGQHTIEGIIEKSGFRSRFPMETVVETNVPHLTERDVHACFQEKEVESKLKATTSAARGVGSRYLNNKHWWKRILLQTFPIFSVLQSYRASYLLGDFMAGISTGIAAVPIGMSYAKLGNFPPEHGLYCQLFYSAVYTFFGTSRQACVGTSAVEGMICAQAINIILGPTFDMAQWYDVSNGLSFFVGIYLILMRCFNLGIISSFLADSVVSGFSTGCAFTIVVSQLQHFFGLRIAQQLKTLQVLAIVFQSFSKINWICFLLGCSGLVLLLMIDVINKKWLSRYPVPALLVFVLVFLFIGYKTRIDKSPYNVAVVGAIPVGLPAAKVFSFNRALLIPTAQQALWYAIVYYLIHVSIVNRFAQKHRYLIDYDQELFATGACSVVGSFFQCYPIATSLARSCLADTAGGHTQLYNVLNVIIIFVVITKLTPLLYYLPWPSLASIVVYGVSKMFHFSEAIRLFKLHSFDFVLWIVSFVITIGLGAMEGIIASVALSLIWIVKQNAFPATAVLGRLPGTKVFRDIRVFNETQEVQGCKILRLIHQLISTESQGRDPSNQTNDPESSEEASLWKFLSAKRKDFSISLSYFPRCNKIQSLKKSSDQEPNHQLSSFTEQDNIENVQGMNMTKIRVVIVDASSVNHVDVTAIRMLKGLAKRLEENSMIMLFANWKGPMRGFLERAHFYDTIPPDHCFLSIHDAVLWAEVFYLHRDPSLLQDPL